jgi:hypothetical protein
MSTSSDSKGELNNCYADKVGKLVFLRFDGTVLEDV